MKASRFSSLVATIVFTAIQWVAVCNLPGYARSMEVGAQAVTRAANCCQPSV